MTAQTAAVQTAKSRLPIRQESEALSTEFDRIYNSIARRAFELFEGNGRWFGHDWDDWFRAEAELLHPVHLEMKETDENFNIRAEVPGFAANDLEISVEPRLLKIAGNRETKEEEKKAKVIRCELCANQILRLVELPADIDTSKVSATLKDGLLTVELPKAEPARTVRIQPKAA